MNTEAESRAALIEELQVMRRRLEAAEQELARRTLTDDVELERQRVERELRQQEERLRLIVDGVRDHAISMLDPQGRIVTFNRAVEQIKGHALEDVRGQYFALFFTPEDRASGLPELELKTASEQGRYEGEGWRERKDGSRFYAAVSLSRLKDDSGELVGFVKVTQDRTQSRELSEALRRRESELRLIIDAIPGLVAYMSVDETYRQVNHAYEDWFGQPAAKLVGKHISDVVGNRAYDVIRTHVAAALAGQSVSFESEVPYASGGSRWVRAQYVPDVDASGNVQGYVSLVLDVTLAKRAEQRLAEEARINETLNRVGTALAQDLDLDTVFARLTDEATALCRAQFGAFFYNVDDPERGRYMLYTLAGVPRDRFAGFPMPRNTEVFAPTFAGQGVVRSDDITKDTRYGKSAPYHGMPEGHLPVRSYLAVPVVSRAGEVHGGLFFGHADTGVFTDRDERLIVAVAAQAAVAIDNARLHAATITAEQQYRALAESSPQLVWTTTPDGTVEYCNPQFLAYVGLSLEQMRREPVWHLIVHQEDVPRATEAWTKAVSTGEPYEVEYRFRRASDSSFRWFLARGVRVADSEGRIVRWIGSCTDIDDHKRSEETHRFLAEAGALLASSLDYRRTLPALAHLAVPHMADWCSIQLLDSNGNLERVAVSHADPQRLDLIREIEQQYPDENDAARRIIHTGTSECVHDITDDMLAVSSRDRHHLELLRLLGLRSWMAVPIKVDQRTTGIISLASSESGRLFEQRDVDIAEEIGRRVGNTIDNVQLFEMTQQERRRAEEASRAKDELLGVTSHELRTPLNAILGWVRMLRSGHLSEDKHERALETIERNAKVQVQLVEDLLDFNRVITGKLRLALAPLEPADVVEAAVDVIRPAAEAKNVRLQLLLDPHAGTLNGDAERLQQIVWNLLSNAVKFTPKDGCVYVRMQREDSHVEIVVADTGSGIAPAFIRHIFQPFRQQDATATRSHGGLGLGLAIVKHLVELHGGSIDARSEGVGKGATFVVRLPVSPLRTTSPSAQMDRPITRVGGTNGVLRCPPELDGLRVLVCEDEPDARELLESILTGCKAKVTLAGSVEEALDRFSESIPDVLISDIGMPQASGYELIRRVRALPVDKGGRVPAVALTAYASMTDRTRALMEGFQNHVAKPTEPQELIAVVAALSGRFARS